MKEATGELSTTVITVVAIAAVLTIFTVILLPSLRSNIRAKTYCNAAAYCTDCADNATTHTCYYYPDDYDGTGNLESVQCACDETVR